MHLSPETGDTTIIYTEVGNIAVKLQKPRLSPVMFVPRSTMRNVSYLRAVRADQGPPTCTICFVSCVSLCGWVEGLFFSNILLNT